jgi:hypothetical protein
MGEPLSNYEAVKAAVGMMGDPRLFGIGARHITVSTVGVIPRIKQMAADLPVGASIGSSTLAEKQSKTPDPRLRMHAALLWPTVLCCWLYCWTHRKHQKSQQVYVLWLWLLLG